MRIVSGLASVFVFASLIGCTPVNNTDEANSSSDIGSSVDALHAQDQNAAQPGCTGMDTGDMWRRPCTAEAPLLGKSVVGLPSLDQEAQPTPALHNPIYVTAKLVPISPVVAPDYGREFSVAATADYLAAGVGRTDKSPEVALKVETGWTGNHRILYFTLETDANGTAPHEFSDVSGSHILPHPDATMASTVSLASGAVALNGQEYNVEISALVPPETFVRLNQPPESTKLREFPAEMPATTVAPPQF
jgi:hypothetical protein